MGEAEQEWGTPSSQGFLTAGRASGVWALHVLGQQMVLSLCPCGPRERGRDKTGRSPPPWSSHMRLSGGYERRKPKTKCSLTGG